jgi:hypothetical protein
MAAPAIVLAGASLAASFAEQPPGAPDEGSPRPAPPPAPREEPRQEGETPRQAAEGEPDDVFIPTEELPPDAAVTFPVDI